MRFFLFVAALFWALPIAVLARSPIAVGEVPFTAQAPFSQWSDPRQQSACEEAAVLMAMHWVKGRPLTRQLALAEILAMAEYEKRRFGDFHDTSAKDTIARLIEEYWKFHYVSLETVKSAQDIVAQLRLGHIVIVPMNGRALGNSYYRSPGPEQHMLLVVGYDSARDEFMTNDPGTRRGQGFRYRSLVVYNAIRDYPTSNSDLPITNPKVMIVVKRQ